MLNKNNIYTLLFMCVTHLGCSLSYSDQMKRRDSKGVESISGSEFYCGDIDLEGMKDPEEGEYSRDDLFYKINSFLRTKRLELGFAITDDILNSALEKLGMDRNIFNLDALKKYKEFLNKYGSIRNTEFDIYQYEHNEDEEFDDNVKKNNTKKKVNSIISIQDSFHNYFVNKPKLDPKNFWLIAKNKDLQYFINLQRGNNVGHIYYVDGFKLVPCSKNFSEFLDKFFEEYEKGIQK